MTDTNTTSLAEYNKAKIKIKDMAISGGYDPNEAIIKVDYVIGRVAQYLFDAGYPVQAVLPEELKELLDAGVRTVKNHVELQMLDLVFGMCNFKPILIEKHGEEFATTPLFWECECDSDYIHPRFEDECPICGSRRESSPDARVGTVLRSGLGIQPDTEDLVNALLGADALEHEDEC